MTGSQQLGPQTGAPGYGPRIGRSAGAQEEPSYWKQLRCQVMFGPLVSVAALGCVQNSPELLVTLALLLAATRVAKPGIPRLLACAGA